jgi:MFS family permease
MGGCSGGGLGLNRTAVIAAIGTGQLLAWGSTFYLPAMLAEPMARDTGVAVPTVFLAFSVAMGGSALVGPWAGRTIDRWGGRPVLIATNLVFASGLAALAAASGPATLFAAWGLIGLAMGAGLYEAAFATVVRLYGSAARDAITGITLLGGFASTLGWPLSAWMEARWGWRGACVGWAMLHLLVALPLHVSVPRAGSDGGSGADGGPAGAAGGNSAATEAGAGSGPGSPGAAGEASAVRTTTSLATGGERRTMVLLAFVFAATWFVTTAIAAHGPRVLQAAGAGAAAALAVGALIGPAQVAARLMQFGPLRRADPLRIARLASLGHPLGVGALLLAGPGLAPTFALLHGAGGGLMTIARGVLPLAFFGPVGYGARQGLLMLPTRIAQALAPFLSGLAIERWGAGALWGSAALGIAAWLALRALRRSPPPP